ncbi:MAG: ABC transporter ATP-binding protein [Phycisphaerae bacterium]|nr:ABC transporter ATP-binding protein [Tepidisphaeraceae bacterium]
MLEAAHLSFAYRPDAPVLRDVSLALAPGSVVVLIGPNGSGKSTLLRLLLGHAKPTAGDVRWDAKPVAQWRPRELARAVAYLPQSPGFDPGATVGDVLRAGRTPHLAAFGIESPADLAVVHRTADDLGLTSLLARPLDELSGGQRQLAFLGRALAQEPRALLLDEPGTFLDLRHQADLWRRLRALATDRHLAVLAASHDLQISASAADQIVLLNNGQVAAAGAPDDVLRPEILSPVYGVEMVRADVGGGRYVVVPRT